MLSLNRISTWLSPKNIRTQPEEVTGRLTDELKQEFREIPNSGSVEELEDYINAQKAEADAIVCGNARVADEHRCAQCNAK